MRGSHPDRHLPAAGLQRVYGGCLDVRCDHARAEGEPRHLEPRARACPTRMLTSRLLALPGRLWDHLRDGYASLFNPFAKTSPSLAYAECPPPQRLREFYWQRTNSCDVKCEI